MTSPTNSSKGCARPLRSRRINRSVMMIDFRMRAHAALLMICAAVACASCEFVQDSRELSTLVKLQALSARLYEIAGTGSAVEREDFESVVHEYFDHREEPWANSIIFIPAPDGESAFLLISTGSDGTLDVAEPEEYFGATRQPASVDREGQDIVLRGSEAIRYGAHK